MSGFDLFVNADESKLKNYGDFIREGEHLLVLKWYGERNTEKYGKVIAAEFVVLESSGPEPHSVGSVVSTLWKYSHGENWKREREITLAFRFVRELCGADQSVAVETIQSTANHLSSKDQPGTGMRIRAFGRKTISKEGKAFTEASFTHVPQDEAMIAATRARITSGASAPAAVPTAQPAPTAAPATKPSLLGSLGK